MLVYACLGVCVCVCVRACVLLCVSACLRASARVCQKSGLCTPSKIVCSRSCYGQATLACLGYAISFTTVCVMKSVLGNGHGTIDREYLPNYCNCVPNSRDTPGRRRPRSPRLSGRLRQSSSVRLSFAYRIFVGPMATALTNCLLTSSCR